MAWSAPAGSTRSPERETNNIFGLASSGCAVIRPELLNVRSKKRSHQVIVKDECEEDNSSDELSPPAEKKRRLTTDQVNFLEMSFTMDLKLEPERKARLAKELGISPRQVAIWFQNRRARWKNKQVEQDFESLKADFEAVMKEKEKILLEREAVLEENKYLQAEVLRLQDLLERMRHGRPIDTMVTGSEGKSGLTSPTKSCEDQGDVQDSGQSCCLAGGAEGIDAIAPTAWELSVKTDSDDYAPIFLPDELYGPPNFALLFHPLAPGGVYLEEGLYSSYDEGHYNGLTCHEYMEL